MRPIELVAEGFGPFRDRVTIDFTDADFFALVGPTGAGKSSVIDAICFALYGIVPRYDDRRLVVQLKVKFSFATITLRLKDIVDEPPADMLQRPTEGN